MRILEVLQRLTPGETYKSGEFTLRLGIVNPTRITIGSDEYIGMNPTGLISFPTNNWVLVKPESISLLEMEKMLTTRGFTVKYDTTDKGLFRITMTRGRHTVTRAGIYETLTEDFIVARLADMEQFIYSAEFEELL